MNNPKPLYIFLFPLMTEENLCTPFPVYPFPFCCWKCTKIRHGPHIKSHTHSHISPIIVIKVKDE